MYQRFGEDFLGSALALLMNPQQKMKIRSRTLAAFKKTIGTVGKGGRKVPAIS
jgi:hypothetical protein